MTIIVILILIYIVYNFMYCTNNTYQNTNNEAVVPQRKITNLEEELRKQYENSYNSDNIENNNNIENNDNIENNNIENDNIENDNNMNSNKNDKNSGNNKTNSMDYNNLNKKIIKEQDGIVLGVIDKSADSGRESLPENIQGVEMVKENKKSNFMMDKNMPYIDLENDMINLSLLPELRT